MSIVSNYQRTERAFICQKFFNNKILNVNRLVEFCKSCNINNFPNHSSQVKGLFDSPQQSKPFSLEFMLCNSSCLKFQRLV